MKINLKIKNTGFVLVEVLVACSILSVMTFTVVSAAQKGIELSNVTLAQTQASFLLEEGAESVKLIRDAAWSNISGLTLGANYYLSYNTTTNLWSLSGTSSTIDSKFTRTIVLSAVYRDSSTQDIVTSGGTLDSGTKKVDVTVSWSSSTGPMSKTLSFYIADIFS